jgi:hypothetical protein
MFRLNNKIKYTALAIVVVLLVGLFTSCASLQSTYAKADLYQNGNVITLSINCTDVTADNKDLVFHDLLSQITEKTSVSGISDTIFAQGRQYVYIVLKEFTPISLDRTGHNIIVGLTSPCGDKPFEHPWE